MIVCFWCLLIFFLVESDIVLKMLNYIEFCVFCELIVKVKYEFLLYWINVGDFYFLEYKFRVIVEMFRLEFIVRVSFGCEVGLEFLYLNVGFVNKDLNKVFFWYFRKNIKIIIFSIKYEIILCLYNMFRF